MKSSFHYRTHAAEAGLIWSILQTKGASTYSRPIGANGPSIALKAFELALSEQQSPTHPARPGVPPDQRDGLDRSAKLNPNAIAPCSSNSRQDYCFGRATADVANEAGPRGRKRNSLIEGDFDLGRLWPERTSPRSTLPPPAGNPHCRPFRSSDAKPVNVGFAEA